MAKPKVKPDLSPANVGINTFTDGLQIFTYKKEYKVLNKFLTEDIKEFELEATPYTKVFEVKGDRKQVIELPVRCKELYLYLIHSIDAAEDCIWIEPVAYMRQMGIKSINTFKEAVRILSENLYIARHVRIKDVYWINPHYFFKGSRINKYPNNVILKIKKIK